MIAAILLLALVPQPVYIGDLDVPRARARGVPVTIRTPTYIECRYETKGPNTVVRTALLTAADIENFQAGKPYTLLAATPYSSTGHFRALLMQPGDYFVLIDNRNDLSKEVKVHVAVTAAEDPSLPRTASSARRQAVTALSLSLFALVAGWSGLRIRRAWYSIPTPPPLR